MIYAGLHKISCDMCGGCNGLDYIITHKDGSTAEVCAVCYGKCLCHDKFNQGVKDGDIKVSAK